MQHADKSLLLPNSWIPRKNSVTKKKVKPYYNDVSRRLYIKINKQGKFFEKNCNYSLYGL